MKLSNLFGAEPIHISDVGKLHEDSPNIILWAAPIMFFFVLLEYVIAKYQKKEYYEKSETVGSILVGIVNVIIGLMVKLLVLYILVIVYNWIPWRMEFQWWTLIPCYIFFDFCSYVAHRVSHHLRCFWATHVPHHSGENYNLTVSFRLSWIQYLKMIFFMPVSILGFHPIIIFITNQIAVLFQFWVHTEYIRKLHPVIEFIFATPSNHRVHHGSQAKYINKNFGATFIIWDRIFKTFQEEDEKPIYGLTHNISQKGNPIHINFHECVDMYNDIKNSKTFKEKLFYFFGDPESISDYKKKQKEALEIGENSQHVSSIDGFIRY